MKSQTIKIKLLARYIYQLYPFKALQMFFSSSISQEIKTDFATSQTFPENRRCAVGNKCANKSISQKAITVNIFFF